MNDALSNHSVTHLPQAQCLKRSRQNTHTQHSVDIDPSVNNRAPEGLLG